MFLGAYTQAMDPEGGVTLPADFQGDLAAGLVITKALDQSLMIFPLEGWARLAAQVAGRPLANATLRAFRRRLFAGAAGLALDQSGRLFIPQELREFAHLGDEVVLAGMYDHLELWDAQTWQRVRQAAEENAQWEMVGI